jgi:enterochelin esterase-like enzyme
MSRAGRLLLLVLAAWVAAGVAGAATYVQHYSLYRGFAPPAHPAGIAAGRLVDVSFFSAALGHTRSYTVALPSGYDAAAARGTRFPVLYLLHGTSGSPRLMIGAGGVQVRFDTLIARRAVPPFIVVMPDGRDGTLRSDTEWANTPRGRYEGLVLDTVRAVDQRWSTIADRNGRAIAGLSEGAYGAVNIALRHLDVFSVVESWSGYYNQSPNGPFSGASSATLAANSPTAYVRSLAPQLHHARFRALLYAGGQDPAVKGQAAFARQLRAAGATVRTTVYPGKHSWRLWRAKMAPMLHWAGTQLGGPR